MEVAENGTEAAMDVFRCSFYTPLNKALVKVLAKMERLVLVVFLFRDNWLWLRLLPVH